MESRAGDWDCPSYVQNVFLLRIYLKKCQGACYLLVCSMQPLFVCVCGGGDLNFSFVNYTDNYIKCLSFYLLIV